MQSPPSSPFAEVIQSLAGLHQEQHQALLEIRDDRERRFCALVQAQQEDRELFRSWMDQGVRAGGSSARDPDGPTHLPLNKMGPQDDPEAFLELFEKSAEACGWPRDHWPVRLIPLLSGEAQMAGPTIARPKPPGLHRPEASHPPAGRPEPRTTSPAVSVAGTGR